MNSKIIPAMNIIDRIIIIGQFIGILISGSFLSRVLSLALFAISNIIIPVSPPEITPPIPRISVKPMTLNCVMMIYRARGTREVSRKLVLLDVFMSYLNVFFRENDRTKYEVSIVKIPRITIRGPNDNVATWLTFVPNTPMKIALNAV